MNLLKIIIQIGIIIAVITLIAILVIGINEGLEKRNFCQENGFDNMTMTSYNGTLGVCYNETQTRKAICPRWGQCRFLESPI